MQQPQLGVDGEFDEVLRGAKELADARSASLFIRDGEDLVRVRTIGPSWFADTARLGQGFIGRVAVVHRPLTVDQSRGPKSVGSPPRVDPQRLLGVPLVHRDAVVGVLALAGAKDRASWNLPLITLLADQFAAAVVAGHRSDAERRFAHELLHRSEDHASSLARAIQDGALPHLAALDACLEFLTRSDVDHGTEDDWLAPAREELRVEIDRLHRISTELRPPILDLHGIEAAVRERAMRAEVESETRFVVNATLEGRPPAALETALFRVADETIGNVVEHARAAHARLSLTSARGSVMLELRDDGIGFTPRDLEDYATSGAFGFFEMRARVEALGGTFTVQSRPSHGCTIRVVI